jgi:glycosyltransferase involved in cell wall biosynthesis
VPTPEISIIMPLFNSAPFVKEAVESLLAQTFRDFELLVVDDGSSDGSPGIVESFADDRIRLLRGGESRGPAEARNRGLAEARGRTVVFFDSDDAARPGLLEELTDFLAAHPDCDMVGAWSEVIDEQGVPSAPGQGYGDRPEKLASNLLFYNCLPTSGLCIRRACLEGLQFDGTLTVASDYDLWARLVVAHKTGVLPRTLARYRVHAQNITHRKKALATECLDRIFRRQLARLGIEPSGDEAALHARLTTLTVGTPKQTVIDAENWLMKLDEANARTAVYPAPLFREILGERWFGVCHSACGNGLWTWRRFHRSCLTRWFIPAPQERRNFLRLCLRGALKKMLPFSAGHPAR